MKVEMTDDKSPLDHNDPVVNDPFLEIYGAKAQGRLLTAGTDDQIPEEVREVLDQYGIGHRKFRCMLKEVPDTASENDNESHHYIKGFGSKIPSVDYIAQEYGPGKYALLLTWREIENDPETNRAKPGKNRVERIIINVSEKMAPLHNVKRLERKLKEAKAAKDRLRQQRIENELEDTIDGTDNRERVDPVASGKKFVQDALETVKSLGFNPNSGGGGFNWKEIMPALLTAAPAIVKYMGDRDLARQNSQMQFMTMMMTAMNNKSTDMIELFRSMQGPQNGNDAVKEFKSMLHGVIDIKQALEGNKETVVDKIFTTVDNVLPMVLQVASQSAQARANNPMVGMAKQFMDKDPNFQQAFTDQEIRDALIVKWDSFYGWEQTDQILQVAGLQRSENTPHRPDMRYPQGDKRNNIADVSVDNGDNFAQAEVVESEETNGRDEIQPPAGAHAQTGEIDGGD